MPNETSNTTGNFWSGIWDAAGAIGSAAVSGYFAKEAAKGTPTPGGAGAGTPAANPTVAPGGNNQTLITTIAIAAAAAVLVLLGIKLIKK
jgi:hypothetical protein